MKSYLIFYPHCYIGKGGNGLIAFDTIARKFVMTTYTNVLKSIDANKNIMEIPTIENEQYNDFVQECITDNLAYKIDANVMPFLPQNDLHVISSYSKTGELHNKMEGYFLLDNVLSISLYLNNKTLDFVDETVSQQIEYPCYCKNSQIEWNIDGFLKTLDGFPNLREIKICGDMDETLENMLKKLTCYSVTIRTAGHNLPKRIATNLRCHNNVKFEILLLSDENWEDALDYEHRVVLSPIVFKPSDVSNFAGKRNIVPIPVIIDANKQSSLIQEMLIDFSDIVNAHNSMDNIKIKGQYNTTYYGHITISTDGTLQCANKKYGSLKVSNLIDILNKCVHDEQSTWLISRKKFARCSKCMFASLCPDVTIYEQQGVMDKICTL